MTDGRSRHQKWLRLNLLVVRLARCFRRRHHCVRGRKAGRNGSLKSRDEVIRACLDKNVRVPDAYVVEISPSRSCCFPLGQRERCDGNWAGAMLLGLSTCHPSETCTMIQPSQIKGKSPHFLCLALPKQLTAQGTGSPRCDGVQDQRSWFVAQSMYWTGEFDQGRGLNHDFFGVFGFPTSFGSSKKAAW